MSSPAIALPALTLRNVRLTFNTLTTINATKITIHREAEDQKKTAGSSGVVQRILGPQDSDISVEFWNDNNFSTADLPFGTLLSALSLLDTEATPVSVLQSDYFTKFPPTTWAVLDVQFDVDGQPGKAVMKMRPNVLATS